MITNEVQYRATKAHLERFEEAATNIEARPASEPSLNGSNSTRSEPRPTICAPNWPTSSSCAAGPCRRSMLPRWRNCRRCSSRRASPAGWTQRQLAEALGMAEQQIQRYEANDYRSTSLARLCDIANALGVIVAPHAELKPSAA